MYCMQRFLKSKYIKSRTFNDKNRWIIKKVMILKKLLPHLATRGTYSPGDWRCDEAWRGQTLVYPVVMCQYIYCTWELNVMTFNLVQIHILPEELQIYITDCTNYVGHNMRTLYHYNHNDVHTTVILRIDTILLSQNHISKHVYYG